MPGRVAWTGYRMDTRRHHIFIGCEPPAARINKLIGKHAAVPAGPGRGQFIRMDMHFAARKIAHPTYMIVMQMTDEHDINIG